MSLKYLIGDATEPTKIPAIIAHCCNDCRPGKWGRGFVMALSKKDKRPEDLYRSWAKHGEINNIKYTLGNVQLAPFKNGIVVANMIAQHGTETVNGVPPIRYDALETALKKLFKYAAVEKKSVHAPRLGAALAGGDWNIIEGIIKKTCGDVETYVYTLPSEKDKWPNCKFEGEE